jgi:hypothetical protein
LDAIVAADPLAGISTEQGDIAVAREDAIHQIRQPLKIATGVTVLQESQRLKNLCAYRRRCVATIDQRQALKFRVRQRGSKMAAQ